MRVNYIAKARKGKDGKLPVCGKCRKKIEPGQPYKWAKGRYTSKMVRCGDCTFKASELTGSDKKARVLAAREALEELSVDITMDAGDVESNVSDIGGDVREVADEYRSAADDYFNGGGPNAEMADEIEPWADEFDSFMCPEKPEFEDVPEDEEGVPQYTDEQKEALEAWVEEAETAIADLAGNCPL